MSQRTQNWFTNLFKRKESILQTVMELDDIYGITSASLNYSKYQDEKYPARQNTLCYGCYKYGHYARDCPDSQQKNEKNNDNSYQTQTTEQSSQQQQNDTTNNQRSNQSKDQYQRKQSQRQTNNNKQTLNLRAIEHSNSIQGWCKLDDKCIRFMADTGAERTVVVQRVLEKSQLDKLKVSKFSVRLADGTNAVVKGLLDCVMSLNNKSLNMEIIVIDSLPEGCLLGFDFLKRHPDTNDILNNLQQVIQNSSDSNSNSTVTINSVSTSDSTTNESLLTNASLNSV